MTAYRRIDELPAESHPIGAVHPRDLRHRQALPTRLSSSGGDAHVVAPLSSETRRYLEMALASRRAAGLPAEIQECEAWKAFGRAINYAGSPPDTLRTSGAGTHSGVHDVHHPCEAEAVAAAVGEAPQAAYPRSRPTS